MAVIKTGVISGNLSARMKFETKTWTIAVTERATDGKLRIIKY